MTPSENITEEYLEAVYKLSENGEKVNLTKLADHLNLRPSTVWEKLQKLFKEGYLLQGDKKALSLTEKGEAKAKDVIRKHRLVEQFLVNTLGLPWDEVHEEACKFEHIMSTKVADALENFLNYPESCPHGHPIPDKNGTILEEPHELLSGLRPGESASVVKVEENSQTLLKHLLSLGIMPGTDITLEQIAPFNGAFLIRMDKECCCYALGREIAGKIWIHKKAENNRAKEEAK